MKQSIPLTQLPKALATAGYNPPGYRACYEAARSARIAADLADNGRWTFDPADLPAIAQALGLSDALAA